MTPWVWRGLPVGRALAVLIAFSGSVLVGCDDTVLPVQTASKPVGVGAGTGLGITFESQSGDTLIGAEAFEITVRVYRLWGQVIVAYGLRTPYENAMHEVRPLLPVPVLGGIAIIRDIAFSQVPKGGLYPYEFWLVTEDGLASDRVHGTMKVQ